MASRNTPRCPPSVSSGSHQSCCQCTDGKEGQSPRELSPSWRRQRRRIPPCPAALLKSTLSLPYHKRRPCQREYGDANGWAENVAPLCEPHRMSSSSRTQSGPDQAAWSEQRCSWPLPNTPPGKERHDGRSHEAACRRAVPSTGPSMRSPENQHLEGLHDEQPTPSSFVEERRSHPASGIQHILTPRSRTIRAVPESPPGQQPRPPATPPNTAV